MSPIQQAADPIQSDASADKTSFVANSVNDLTESVNAKLSSPQ
jgi:hypothetical protein